MAAGINLTNDVIVYLGEIKEQLLYDLDKYKIKYDIMFDKINKDGIKETIIHIKDIGTEIIIRNDIVYYIMSGITEFTQLDRIEVIGSEALNHIKRIHSLLEERFSKEGYNIKIEKIDTTTMNITVILTSDTERVRIQILRGNQGEIYINTLIEI